RRPPSLLVAVAQPRHRLDDRVVERERRLAGTGERVAVVPAAVGLYEAEQLVVGAGEGGRPQRGDHGDLVRRVIDGGEDGEQVLHLLRLVHQAAALEAVRDPRLLEGREQRGEAGARG